MSDLPEGWIETNIGEVVSLAQGVAINAKTKHVLCEKSSGLPLLKINNLLNNTVDQYADPNLVPTKAILKKSDVVFTRTGQVGWVFTNKIGILHNNSFKVIPTNKLDNKFLFWFLKQKPIYNYVQKVASGSAQPDLNHGAFKTIRIAFPALPEQKAIANILTAFDKKIALLQAQNQTLETLAQTVFKEWFVDFNYPDATGEMIDSELGMIPKEWRVGNLLNVFKLTGGGTPKTSIKEYWDGDIPWFSVVDTPKENSCFVIETEKKISQLGLSNSSTKLLRQGTTIVSARGTVGKLALVGQEMAMNQSCYGINGKNDIGDYYVFFQMKKIIDYIKKNVHGAVFDTITKATFEHIDISIAPIKLIETFEKLASTVMHKILNNVHQIQSLTKTRDTLLPKLMNGTIRLNNSQIA